MTLDEFEVARFEIVHHALSLLRSNSSSVMKDLSMQV